MDYAQDVPWDVAVFGLGLDGGGDAVEGFGDMVPQQMMSRRPLPGWSDYRTPIKGLYL